MFGPVVTTEAHLAFSGAETQPSNTDEMTAMIEALSYLGPHGPVARDEQSCILIMILSMLLVFPWARSRLVHTCSWQSLVNGPCYAPNTGFGSPCNTCMDTVAIWVMIVLTTLHLGHSDLPPATMLPPAGFINNFDTSVCFDGCNNINVSLETFAAHWNRCNVTSRKWKLALCSPSGSVCLLCSSRAFLCHW